MTWVAIITPAAAPLPPQAPAVAHPAAAGPGGCTGKNGTCKGRGGADGRCAAHKDPA